MCYIYTITSLEKYDIGDGLNRLVYVGSCVDYEARFAHHKYDCLNPKSRTYGSKLYKFMRQYGFDNFVFEVIEVLDDDTTDIELRQMEQSYIDKFDSKRSMNTNDAVFDLDKSREKSKLRYAKNADKIRHKTAENAEQRKKYYADNIDKIKEYQEEYRNKNRDKNLAYKRAWRLKKKLWVDVMDQLKFRKRTIEIEKAVYLKKKVWVYVMKELTKKTNVRI